MTHSRITVIGADDPLGEAVVREALVRGVAVTATAASLHQLPRLSRHLELTAAQPRSQSEIAAAARASDAVVLGLSPQLDAEPTMTLTDATIATVRALRQVSVNRLVAASSIELSERPFEPVLPADAAAGASGHAASSPASAPTTGIAALSRAARVSADRLRSLAMPLQRRLHHGGLQDLRRLELLLQGSGLDWTVLRAGTLTDLLGTKRQQVVPAEQGGSATLAREDLARAMLDQALQPGREPRLLTVTAR